MKNILVGILLLFSFITKAQSADALFLKANDHYKNGNYEKAIEIYQKIDSMQVVSSELYFNLGNSYYKLNKVAPTIYFYEKALKINPLNEDARLNLSFATRMTIDAIEELPKTFLQKFSGAVIRKSSYNTWGIIAVSASFLMALSFLLYYFSISSGKKLFYFNTSLFMVIVMVITLFFAYSNYQWHLKNREAIIFAPEITIKNAPTNTSDEVFELHEGTKVIILDELDNWSKIKIADGKVGWLKTELIKEI